MFINRLKSIVISFGIALVIFGAISHIAQAQDVNIKAQIFEPGVISLEDTWDEYISFSPDGKTLSFTRSGPDLPHRDRRIYMSNKVNGSWTKPELASFSGDFFDRGSSFSPDGNTIFFGSNRPGAKGFDFDFDIWFSSKKFDGSWSKATRLSDEINSDEYNEGHPYIADSGNLYFVRWKRGVETDIYVSKRIDGKYQKPVKLNDLINTEGPDSHCYIDPKERFLIFAPTDRKGGFGGGDIYISYRKNGEWQNPVNLGASVNTEYYEYSAKPGPENKLYFTRAGFGNPERKPADIYFIPIKGLIK